LSLFIISCVSSFSQRSYHSINFFEDYLPARIQGDTVSSIDSIVRESNYGAPVAVFIALKKDAGYNVTKGKVWLRGKDYTPGKFKKWDTLYASYDNEGRFEKYAYLHHFYEDFDTMWAVEYDENRNLVMRFRKDEVFCKTGNPPAAEKYINIFDENNLKIKSIMKVRWDDDCEPCAPDIWYDKYIVDYRYENGLLKQEYHAMAPLYFKNENKVDTFVTTMQPVKKMLYAYNEDDKLSEYTIMLWDGKNGIFKNYLNDTYDYKGDTVISIRSFWKDNIMQWENYYLFKKLTKDGHEEKFVMFWDKENNKWINDTHSYYVKSAIDGYYDYFEKKWNRELKKWVDFTEKKYFYSGDTIVRLFENPWFPTEKELFLYDERGNLVKNILYQKPKDTGWHFVREITRKYDELNNIVEKYTRLSFEDRYEKIRYYWQKQKTFTFETLLERATLLYPNPAKARLFLKKDIQATPSRYEVYNVNGNLILSGKGESVESQGIDISTLPKGMYLLKLVDGKGAVLSLNKFIKM